MEFNIGDRVRIPNSFGDKCPYHVGFVVEVKCGRSGVVRVVYQSPLGKTPGGKIYHDVSSDELNLDDGNPEILKYQRTHCDLWAGLSH